MSTNPGHQHTLFKRINLSSDRISGVKLIYGGK